MPGLSRFLLVPFGRHDWHRSILVSGDSAHPGVFVFFPSVVRLGWCLLFSALELLPAVMCLVCILFCWFAPLLCLSSSSSSSCWLRLALVLCCCSRLLVFLLLPCGFSSPWGVSALTVGVGVCSLVLWGFCLPWAVSVPRIAVMAAGLFGLLGVLLALVPCGCSPPWCESVLAVGVSVLGLLPTLD